MRNLINKEMKLINLSNAASEAHPFENLVKRKGSHQWANSALILRHAHRHSNND